MPLTQKMRLYVEARLSGKNQKQSALYAGCPAASADVSASRYERHPEIIALLSRMTEEETRPAKKAKAEKSLPVAKAKPDSQRHEKPPEPSPEVFQKKPVAAVAVDCEDLPAPLRFIANVMNDIKEDPKLRLDAAKALAAFTVAKPGEKGKKEMNQAAAERVASKFAPSAPPKLVAAGGRKV